MRHQRKANRSISGRYSTTFFYRKLAEAFDLDGFLFQAAALLKGEIAGIDTVVVYLYDDSARQLVPVSVSGCKRDHVYSVPLEAGVSVIARVFAKGRPFLQQAEKKVTKVLAGCFDPGYTNKCRVKFFFCVPMDLRDGTRIGCLLFLSAAANFFSPRQLVCFRRMAKILGPFVYKAQTLRQEQEKKYSSLVCTLSHELRTPLTCIKGYATTLLNDTGHWNPEERREFLKIIDSETDTMTELINDLIDSSMIESGLLNIKKEPVLLPRIIEKAVNDARLRTVKHRFVVSIPKKFPVLEADPVRTRQVLDNLLNNAIKYSPEGGLIVIQCSIGSREVTLSVADEGMGIAPEHLNRLFEKFYRVKSDFAGTGLGLPVACEIIEKQGGRIWAKSTPGKGSIFYFTLPLTAMSPVAEGEEG